MADQQPAKPTTHAAIAELLQRIANETGEFVQSVSVSWINDTRVSDPQPRGHVHTLAITSTVRGANLGE